MSAIINALFGTYPEQQDTITEQNTVSSELLHTSVVADDVQIKSVISSETQANATMNTKLNIDNLLTQLGTTHAQVDEYSRTRTAEINEQVQKSIADVLANTQRQQEELLIDANHRHLIIDNEYQIQLQKVIETLDAVKAKTLADLEHDLQAKQQVIMNEAKKQIDLFNDQANAAQLNVLIEAQEQAKEEIGHLTDQVAAVGQQETQNVLQSTTTTVITSQAQTVGNTETVIITETVGSSSESVPPVISPTAVQENVPVVDTVTGVSDVITTPLETIVAITSTDVTSNNNLVETEVKPLQDNTTV